MIDQPEQLSGNYQLKRPLAHAKFTDTYPGEKFFPQKIKGIIKRSYSFLPATERDTLERQDVDPFGETIVLDRYSSRNKDIQTPFPAHNGYTTPLANQSFQSTL